MPKMKMYECVNNVQKVSKMAFFSRNNVNFPVERKGQNVAVPAAKNESLLKAPGCSLPYDKKFKLSGNLPSANIYG